MSGIETGAITAFDLQGLQSLKAKANEDPQQALQGAAKEFEALFLQMMLKAMRATVPEGGLESSSTGKLYQELLDQQWAKQLSGRGFGLADMLTAQLSRELRTQEISPSQDTSSSQARLE
jgi:Rod binding protein